MDVSDEELGFVFVLSEDGLVSAVYVESSKQLTQEEFLNALRYFIDRTEGEEMDLYDGDLTTH